MSSYPGALDVLVNPISTDTLDDPDVLHDLQHANINDAVEAIQTTLGINPQGASLSVDARLDAIDVTLTNRISTGLLNVANGVATTDSGNKIVQNIDAGKMNSGVLAVARIPSLDAVIINSGIFGVARIPNLDTAKITTGQFATARIPNLDGSIITTGTIALARLPGGLVGINTIVADIAARDALTGKIDGMIVLVRSNGQVFWWNATGAVWVFVGGGYTQPANVSQAADETGYSSAVFIAGTNTCGITFVAPASGKVYVRISANLEINQSGSVAYCGMEVREGGTIGSGTVVRAASSDEAVAVGGATATVVRNEATRSLLVTGMTAGSTYNVRTMHLIAGGGTADIFYRELLVEPVAGI